jgi:uncharacterized protein
MPQTHEMERSQPNPQGGAQPSETNRETAPGNSVQAADANSTPATSESQQEDGRRRDNLSAEQRSAIGRKGGEAVSRNREHMAQIGRKGGVAVSRDREHMASIGQKGGRS